MPQLPASCSLRPDQGVDGGGRLAVPLHGAADPGGADDAQPGQSRGYRLGGVQDDRALRSAGALGEVGQVVADHEQVFVVEQNRDAQLRTLLITEEDINPAKLSRVLHYDGTPITARFIAGSIAETASSLKIVPLRKVVS